MGTYSICLFQQQEKLQFVDTYKHYKEASDMFSLACRVYNQTPIDAICALQRDDVPIEAIRFTKDHAIFRVDTTSLPFQTLMTRLETLEHKNDGSSEFQGVVRRLASTSCNIDRDLAQSSDLNSCSKGLQKIRKFIRGFLKDFQDPSVDELIKERLKRP